MLGVILVLLAKPVFAKRPARLVLMVERLNHGRQLPKNGLHFGLIVCGLVFLWAAAKAISLGTFALLVAVAATCYSKNMLVLLQ